MTRKKAALIHLLISLSVVSSVVLFIYLVWYPQPIFDLSGVSKPIKILFMVDVVIGPILTFLIYVEGKKGLKFDLFFIAFAQMIALSWGIYTINSGRANLIVLRNGEFNYMIEKFANNEKLRFEELKPQFFREPQLAFVEKKYLYNLRGAYDEIEPITDYEKQVFTVGLTATALKQELKNKSKEINQLAEKNGVNDILFYRFIKEEVFAYIALSKSKKKFIGYIESE